MNKQIESSIIEEIGLIVKVLTHPAGYNVDLFGTMLSIRGTEDPNYWEVSWEEADKTQYNSFSSIQEAVTFFVDKRYELCLGLDFEKEKV